MSGEILVVFRTPIGFRGGSSHTGDLLGWSCGVSYLGRCKAEGQGLAPKRCPLCDNGYPGPRNQFAEFPGEILTEGTIAQGAAGRMGSGRQLVAIVPAGAVFRTGYSGRLYGHPSSHYYMWDGEALLSATWQERDAADLW